MTQMTGWHLRRRYGHGAALVPLSVPPHARSGGRHTLRASFALVRDELARAGAGAVLARAFRRVAWVGLALAAAVGVPLLMALLAPSSELFEPTELRLVKDVPPLAPDRRPDSRSRVKPARPVIAALPAQPVRSASPASPDPRAEIRIEPVAPSRVPAPAKTARRTRPQRSTPPVAARPRPTGSLDPIRAPGSGLPLPVALLPNPTGAARPTSAPDGLTSRKPRPHLAPLAPGPSTHGIPDAVAHASGGAALDARRLSDVPALLRSPADPFATSAHGGTPIDGVPLEALAACRTDAEQDSLKQQVMSAVEMHEICRSEKGTYRFLQTRNLNSFLLWVKQSPDREARNWCRELEFALSCLEQQRQHEEEGS